MKVFALLCKFLLSCVYIQQVAFLASKGKQEGKMILELVHNMQPITYRK